MRVVAVLIVAVGVSLAFDMTKQHPRHVLQTLATHCKHNENTCHLSVRETSSFLESIVELLINYDVAFEEETGALVERLVRKLDTCFDVVDVENFERRHGSQFEGVITKASNLLSKVPDIERHAVSGSVLRPPPFV